MDHSVCARNINKGTEQVEIAKASGRMARK